MNDKSPGIIFLLAMMVLAGNGLYAQDSTLRHLSLPEAIDLSIKNSKELKSGNARTDRATAAVQEARDQRLPDVKISGSYLRLNSPNVSLKTKPGTGATDSNSVKVSSVVYGLANVSLPLYSGLRIRNGIEAAKYQEQAVRADAAGSRDNVVLNTVTAYINLYKAKAAVALVKENLEQSRQRGKDFSNLEKNGLLARNDLLTAQLQTSNIELSLFDAESNYRLAVINMDILLGLPEKTILETDTASTMQVPAALKPVDEYLKAAADNRNDLKAMAFRSKAAATGIKIAKGTYYPGVALTGGYVAADIPGLLTITNAVNIGLGVQYSVSSLWKSKAKLAEAKAQEQELLANGEGLQERVRAQIYEAYQAYLVNREKIQVYQQAIEQAKENYTITNNKYNNSLVTTTELLNADVAQLQAKLNHAFAQADLVVAYNKLLQVSGLLPSATQP